MTEKEISEQGEDVQAGRVVSMEEFCGMFRDDIQCLKVKVNALLDHRIFRQGDRGLDGPNIPPTRNANIEANITLAFRHLEDARMRLGKVMQACHGGISKFDCTTPPKPD